MMTPQPMKPKVSPFMPYLKPIFPQAPNPYEPALYKGLAKNYPGEQIDIKVIFYII